MIRLPGPAQHGSPRRIGNQFFHLAVHVFNLQPEKETGFADGPGARSTGLSSFEIITTA
jgi:hypothetical protein